MTKKQKPKKKKEEPEVIVKYEPEKDFMREFIEFVEEILRR